MKMPSRNKSILFISTFPPKKCGIASFANDLVTAIGKESSGRFNVEVCALDKMHNRELYELPVTMLMDSQQFEDCVETAELINRDSNIQLVSIDHEFGLYGGELGELLLGFLALLEKTFVIRFHTVLPTPSTKMLNVVKAIGKLASRIIVMTKNSARILEEYYGIPTENIIIIPHGTHNHSTVEPNLLKIKYNLKQKKVLTTFGLLSPNKGIEKGILAMRHIKTRFPDVMYVILGQTHPNLLEQEGERYREYLQDLISENGLHEHVRLINEFVPDKKLMEYLALTDIYLFTSKDPNQAVSGTFLYAMAAGCPIISTDFVLGREMLDDHTGIILKTDKETELAESVVRILDNPMLAEEMRKNAFSKTKDSAWNKVGKDHVELFNDIMGIKPTNTLATATQTN